MKSSFKQISQNLFTTTKLLFVLLFYKLMVYVPLPYSSILKETSDANSTFQVTDDAPDEYFI
tara:strand:- start:960 stop:1145 length:186 start_codon:yes stop_codon:yes gene_type:complete